jgi:N utilization substance protein B
MSVRREARERALSLCYELEARNLDAETLLAQQPVAPDPYTVRLVRGVQAHAAEIDALLEKTSEHWALTRMPAVDRAILRLATYELLHEPGVPAAVIINEAVELARAYSTKDSGRFVNGVLARIAEDHRPRRPAGEGTASGVPDGDGAGGRGSD